MFVKKPQRVEALALIMALTLMIYTLAERKLRQALEDQNQTVGDQRKQPTAKPTFRWIMQKFQGIHWINLRGCLKRVAPGIVRRQETAKILNSAEIIRLYRYSFRPSLAFQTSSEGPAPDQ